MKHAYTLFIAVALFFTTHAAHAQLMMDQGQLTVYAGISSPTGDFGDDDGDDAGGATLGFSVTGEYTVPFGTEGLGWVSSVSIIVNGVDEPENFEAGYWINVPVMTGLKYQTEASATLDVYGLGQVGLNLNKAPNFTRTYGDGSQAETSFDIATSFSFGVGAGVIFNDQINVSLRYLALGEPEITGTEVYEGEEYDTNDYDQPISMIQLVVGIDL